MKNNKIIILSIILALAISCNSSKNKTNTMTQESTNSYGADKEFLKEYLEIIELTSGEASILLSQELQGRVMTSTSNGDRGISYGWINYDFFKEKENKNYKFNPFGGEERFWLGPEGGQFSIYFKPGDEMNFKNWKVPEQIDRIPFDVIKKSANSVSFQKEMHLTNYSGTPIDLLVDRKINLFSNVEIEKELGITLNDNIQSVGYCSENTIKNIGNAALTKETGTVSIWILCMLNPSVETNVVIPYVIPKENSESKIVTDDYFGIPDSTRLKVTDKTILFKTDGKFRSKIGVDAEHATNISGSYDAKNKVLSISKYSLTPNAPYVNSLWEMQEQPFKGDAVNAYNDGPVEDGTQMGPFYEIESSSPAAFLKPGENLIHINQMYHFSGDETELNKLSVQLLGISIDEIMAF